MSQPVKIHVKIVVLKSIHYIHGHVLFVQPFFVTSLITKCQTFAKTKSVLKRLISSAASSLSQLATEEHEKNFSNF